MIPALSEQAAVTQWPLRILLVLLTLLVIALALLMLRRGWVRRGKRQHLELPEAPDAARALATQPAVAGKYVGTITAGHSLDRIVAAGTVAAAEVRVGAAGVRIDRAGTRPLVISAEQLTDVTTTPGMLQRYYGRHGLLLVSWLWDGREVSSGLWFPAADDQAAVRRRLDELTGRQPAAATEEGA